MYRRSPRPRLENVLRGPSGDAVPIFTHPLARVRSSGLRHWYPPGDVSQKGPSFRVKLAKHPRPRISQRSLKLDLLVSFLRAERGGQPRRARGGPWGPVWVPMNPGRLVTADNGVATRGPEGAQGAMRGSKHQPVGCSPATTVILGDWPTSLRVTALHFRPDVPVQHATDWRVAEARSERCAATVAGLKESK